jgi:hypothetical protein
VRNDLQYNKKRLYHEDDRLQHVKNIVTTSIYNICNIKISKNRRRQVLRSQRGEVVAGRRARMPRIRLRPWPGGRPADGELMSL